MIKSIFALIVFAVSSLCFAGEPAILKKTGISPKDAVSDFLWAGSLEKGSVAGHTDVTGRVTFADGFYVASMLAEAIGKEVQVRIIVTQTSGGTTGLFANLLGVAKKAEDGIPVDIGRHLEKRGYVWVTKNPDEAKQAGQAPVREGVSAQPSSPQPSSP